MRSPDRFSFSKTDKDFPAARWSRVTFGADETKTKGGVSYRAQMVGSQESGIFKGRKFHGYIYTSGELASLHIPIPARNELSKFYNYYMSREWTDEPDLSQAKDQSLLNLMLKYQEIMFAFFNEYSTLPLREVVKSLSAMSAKNKINVFLDRYISPGKAIDTKSAEIVLSLPNDLEYKSSYKGTYPVVAHRAASEWSKLLPFTISPLSRDEFYTDAYPVIFSNPVHLANYKIS